MHVRPATRRDVLRQADALEKLAERKAETAKHGPTPFDKRRAQRKSDHYFDAADAKTASLPNPTRPCPGGCGYPAPTYDGDPCPSCAQQALRPQEDD